jgi:hypothetical protein
MDEGAERSERSDPMDMVWMGLLEGELVISNSRKIVVKSKVKI